MDLARSSFAVVLACFAARSTSGQGTLFPGYQIPLGTSATRVVPVDMNFDGKLDLVTVPGAAAVFGLGGGKYKLTPNGLTAHFATGGDVGDVNHDGVPDVVVAFKDQTFVGVFLGNPVIGFTYASEKWTGDEPWTAALADFNGDGHLDILTGNVYQSSYSVLMGLGNGGFSPPAAQDAPLTPYGLDTADVDADGDVDAVACGYPSLVGLLINSGGVLNPTLGIPVAVSPSTADLADLDGDGQPEVVTNNGDSDYFAVGKFTGSTVGFQYVATGGGKPYGCATGDANGDGAVDVLASFVHSPGPGELAVFYGSGTGAFLPALKYAANTGRPFVADIDGDALLDVAAPATGGLHVLFGLGSGQFQSASMPTFPPTGSNSSEHSTAGDLNGDGWLDVVVTHYTSAMPVSVLLSNGPASLGAPVIVPSAANSFWSGLADFDADGELDLVTALESGGPEKQNLSLRHGDGLGGFGPAALYPTGVYPNDGVIADFDLDGRPDVASSCYGNVGMSTVSVFRNDGSGGLLAAVNHSVPYQAAAIDVAELSGDAWPDLVVGPCAQKLRVLANLGGGTFGAGPVLPFDSHHFDLVDVDADGVEDLLTTVGPFSGNGKIEVRKGIGSAAFILIATLQPSVKKAFDAVAADFDADGRTDVAASSNSLSVFRGTAPGVFGQEELYGTVSSPHALTAADLDHDGRLDLLVSSDLSGSGPWNSLAVHLNLLQQPVGATPFAIGSPSCGGIQGMGTGVAPKVGESAFALTCTNAPPSAKGFLLLGTTGSYLGVDPFGLGLVLHVDPLGSFFGLLGTKADPVGFARKPLPIPADASLGGAQLYAQTAWIEPIGPGCSASPLPLSTSSGLQITIAP